MSLNKLVGGDCGGNNPLVQLSNIVSRDASISNPFTQVDNFVNEFLTQNVPAPQTFNMNMLLNNIPEVNEINKVSVHEQPGTSQVPVLHPQMNLSWFSQPSSTYTLPPAMAQPFYIAQNQLVHSPISSNNHVNYLNNTDITTITENDLKAKSQEYVNNFKEEELNHDQFLSFIKRVTDGDIFSASGSKDDVMNELKEKYKYEWDKLSNVSDYWDSETAYGISKEYTFTEGNIMLENKSALELGKEKLTMGDIPGAVLCFEAAAQQQPNSAEAWFLLGRTQTENEQDPLAITALKNSLEIDPTQLEAYITLAAAYANENMPKYAYIMLLECLKASKYSDIFPQDIDPKQLNVRELETHVKSLYLKAAQLNPTQIDSEIQNALGVVFNLSREYDKAVDCFKTALLVDSNNSKIWNRLGATLANSERSEEAVDAYHQALNLEPGFIRARYNVGITCMNLQAYRQAAEHFLVALNQQNKAKNMYPDSTSTDITSSTIWTTLRMVCSFMGEHDVAKLVDDRNLTELNKFFEIDS